MIFLKWAVPAIGIYVGISLITDADLMKMAATVTIFTIGVTVAECIMYLFGRAPTVKRAEIGPTEAPPSENTVRCASCHREHVPVTDISGRQMCPWCGHYRRSVSFVQKYY